VRRQVRRARQRTARCRDGADLGARCARGFRDFSDELAGDARYLEAYREGFGFHGVHPLLGLFPLTRLRHAGRVVVAGADPRLVAHAGLEPAASVE
jgi:hypothetical protein